MMIIVSNLVTVSGSQWIISMSATMLGCLMLGSVTIGYALISYLMNNLPNLLTVYIFSALTPLILPS
jgi:hypothetical protein